VLIAAVVGLGVHLGSNFKMPGWWSIPMTIPLAAFAICPPRHERVRLLLLVMYIAVQVPFFFDWGGDGKEEKI
jgi:hypothetical protein